MELKYWILIFVGILMLFYIFHNSINNYIKKYHPWTVNSIINKIDSSSSSPKKVYKYETRCREIFEDIFKTDFPKVRPSFIVNDRTGKKLELDGYNDKLKLAFEYQGQQHYNFSPYFHKSQEDFANQVYRDKLKKELCEKNNITLIEIPYNIEYGDLEDYIKMKLHDEGFYA
jgi:hypothetical protein